MAKNKRKKETKPPNKAAFVPENKNSKLNLFIGINKPLKINITIIINLVIFVRPVKGNPCRFC
jgi:hypothetical protein